MSPNLNTRARLNRALRNNQKIYSAWETFRKFRWFTLAVIVIMPVYPSLSALGSGYDQQTGDYDESTIITAYNSDTLEGTAYVGENGMISTDFNTATPVVTKNIAQDADLATHVVQSGDTLDTIASRYGVSSETILWANDLSPDDALTPGMSLRIPPVSGVVYSVQPGDTLSQIATHYSVDISDIIRVNHLADAASIRDGVDLMIPGAARKIEPAKPEKIADNPPGKVTPLKTSKPTPPTTSSTGLKSRYSVKNTGSLKGFAWGNCTAYVAMNKNVTWRGNAKQWMSNARAAGVKTGSTPVPGAIIQFSGHGYNRYYGHVGIVADVTDDYIIVKDMNYRRLNEVTIRKVPKGDAAIDGYIYTD